MSEPLGRRALWLTTVLAFVIGVVPPAVQYAVSGRVAIPSHDDAISLLAATGAEGRMIALLSEPGTLRTTAGRVMDLIDTDQAGSVGEAVADLYRLDAHPPLYFLTLRWWQGTVGKGVGAALVLSLLACGSAVALLGMTGARWLGPSAALLWCGALALSNAYRQAALCIRQYSLLVLWSVLLTLVVARRIEPERPASWRDAAVFVGLAAIAILTAYQSMVLVLALLVVWWVEALASRRAGESGPAYAAAAGTLAVYSIVLALAAGQRKNAAGMADLSTAVRSALESTVSLFTDLPFSALRTPVLFVAAVGLVGAILAVAVAQRRTPRASQPLLAALPAIGVVYSALILTGAFPTAFSPRYVGGIAAALTLLIMRAAAGPGRAPARAAALPAALLLLSAVVFGTRLVHYSAGQSVQDQEALNRLRDAAVVITDARRQGWVVGLASRLRSDANLWLLDGGVDAATCSAISGLGYGHAVALVLMGTADAGSVSRSISACLGAGYEIATMDTPWRLTTWTFPDRGRLGRAFP